jgi:HK97 family phage major capsid protein
MPALSREELRECLNGARADEQRLRNQRDDLLQRARADGALNDPGVVEKTNRLTVGIDNAHERAREVGAALTEYERDIARIEEAAKDPRNRETAEFIGSDRQLRTRTDSAIPAHATQSRDAALRTIERHTSSGALSAEAADRVDGVLRGPDAPFGVDAAYIEAAGAPEYQTAFVKLLRYGAGAALRMTAREAEAVQRVTRAEEMRAAMAEGAGGTGGFAIPIAIDPTINLSSNGAINPIRALAQVRPMATRELRLVASDGVVAQYQLEAAEAIDNAPTLTQPTLVASRATSFVPFSFELGDDWP